MNNSNFQLQITASFSNHQPLTSVLVDFAPNGKGDECALKDVLHAEV